MRTRTGTVTLWRSRIPSLWVGGWANPTRMRTLSSAAHAPPGTREQISYRIKTHGGRQSASCQVGSGLELGCRPSSPGRRTRQNTSLARICLLPACSLARRWADAPRDLDARQAMICRRKRRWAVPGSNGRPAACKATDRLAQAAPYPTLVVTRSTHMASSKSPACELLRQSRHVGRLRGDRRSDDPTSACRRCHRPAPPCDWVIARVDDATAVKLMHHLAIERDKLTV